MVSKASSSSADETNQVSKALGGAYTPASSRAWKNGANRKVSDARAAAKSSTGASVKNTDRKLPARATRWATPAADRASPSRPASRSALASSAS